MEASHGRGSPRNMLLGMRFYNGNSSFGDQSYWKEINLVKHGWREMGWGRPSMFRWLSSQVAEGGGDKHKCSPGSAS